METSYPSDQPQLLMAAVALMNGLDLPAAQQDLELRLIRLIERIGVLPGKAPRHARDFLEIYRPKIPKADIHELRSITEILERYEKRFPAEKQQTAVV